MFDYEPADFLGDLDGDERSDEELRALIDGLGDDRALAEVLAAPPGAGTALALLGINSADLDDFAQVEVAAAWRRIAAWAERQAARAAAELASRRSMNPEWPAAAGTVSEPCVAGVELAMRLGISRRAGSDLVRLGQALDGPLWPTGQALARGEIDERKARLIVRALAESPLQVAVAVQEAVLPTAARRTHAQLTADLARALVEVDPQEADRRFARARRERHVGSPRALPDGMAGLWAVLPAPTAVALDRTLDAVARHARADGDARTLAQLRADALTAAVLGDEELRARLRSAAECMQHSEIVAASAHGRSQHGPSTPGRTQHGPSKHDPPPHGPSKPHQGAVPNLLDLDRILAERVRVDVRVVVPADNLLDDATAAAHLAGAGAIPPLAARALAAGGLWRRIVTDPGSGAVLDVGRTRYRPTTAIVDHLVERDTTCVRPGCSSPSDRCDMDHRVPWEDGGHTSVENLAPLCRADHLLKTHAGHRLRRAPDGTVTWVTPTGQVHRRPPDRPDRPLSESDTIPF